MMAVDNRLQTMVRRLPLMTGSSVMNHHPTMAAQRRPRTNLNHTWMMDPMSRPWMVLSLLQTVGAILRRYQLL